MKALGLFILLLLVLTVTCGLFSRWQDKQDDKRREKERLKKEREQWQELSHAGLNRAYGDDEPEY